MTKRTTLLLLIGMGALGAATLVAGAGDADSEGTAPQTPEPLSEDEKRRLEVLLNDGPDSGEPNKDGGT